MKRNTLLNLGRIFFMRTPAMSCPVARLERFFLEQESAKKFALEDTHSVLILMLLWSRCKCNPCAQRSKGDIGHREETHNCLATVLSISIVVNFPEQRSAKVSNVISSAKNSATHIFTWPCLRSPKSLIPPHWCQDICQKRPPIPPPLVCGSANLITPAIPHAPEASQERVMLLTGNWFRKKEKEDSGFPMTKRRQKEISNTARFVNARCLLG